MKAIEDDRKTIQTETRRLIKNLSRRIARIEGKENLAQYTVKEYKKLEIPKKLKELDDKELTKLYRDLKYVSNLKTSTVKGARTAYNKFEPVKEKLNVLSPEVRDRFWSVYGKLYERNPTMEHFKYEIFDTSIDYIFGGQESDQAVKDIINEYDKTLKELGGNATNDDIKVLFTSKLNKLSK